MIISQLEQKLDNDINDIVQCFEDMRSLSPVIVSIASLVSKKLSLGGTVYFCGNGGSAADSQHLAAELQGRYLADRASMASIALTTNTSTLTAIANDYSFAEIFSRQIEGLGKQHDVLFCISTSGNSENVIRAARAARGMGLHTVSMTGAGGGMLAEICDHSICVPSDDTPHIQEMHIAVGHMICGIVEGAL